MTRRDSEQFWAGSRPDLLLLAKALREQGKELEKELKQVNKASAKKVVDRARANMSGLGGLHAKARNALTPITDRARVGVRVSATSRHPYALAAYWGGLRRTGWNRGNRTPNLPRWVGNQWTPGMTGSGGTEPYGLGAAMDRQWLDEILKEHSENVEKLIDKAFGGA